MAVVMAARTVDAKAAMKAALMAVSRAVLKVAKTAA